MDPRACFVTASNQNVFFEELLDALAVALAAAGIATERSVDMIPPPEPGLAYVMVPHEYLPLAHWAAHPTAHQMERTVLVDTEQPDTHWFEKTAEVALDAGAIIDIHPLGVQALRKRGADARLMPLGYVPGWDRWQGDDAAERPVDVTFMGGYSPRRARALGECASILSRHRSAIHLYRSDLPHKAADQSFFSGERKWEHLSRSKILLNIHRGDSPYFEWQRVLGAIENGAVVITDHAVGFDPLVPGEHFISVGTESLPQALDLLLSDPDRLAELRSAAYSFVREELRLEDSIGVLAEAVTDVAARPVPDEPKHGSLDPLPKAPDPPPRMIDAIAGQKGSGPLLRAAVKRLAVDQQVIRRELLEVREGPAPPDRVTFSGPYEQTEPTVSVVLTAYQYERLVPKAIRSVSVSEYTDLELVVVEDASPDATLAAVERALAEAPWLAAAVVAKGRNRGLAAARNAGIDAARGRYVFVLDADNEVLPHGIGRLVEGLESDPRAAYAYGIISTYEPAHGPRDLMSWLAYDRRAFAVVGNYIDAMALVRRDALLAAGGFSDDPRLYGWEDFALWCALAERGEYGIQVPEIVARYRTGRFSMISTTNLDAAEAYAVLHDAYPFLDEVEA